MATDYISRSEFDRTMQERYCFNCERKGNHPIFGVACKACWVMDMLDEVEQFQSADVRPVVRAFWVGEHDGVGICSNCNRLDHIDPLATHCRYCGANLRKVVEIDQVKEDDT